MTIAQSIGFANPCIRWCRPSVTAILRGAVNHPPQDPGESPAEYLGRLLRRSGSNPHRLSVETGNAVSATTVRGYIAGENVSKAKLLIIARALEAPEVLRAYGFDELGDGLRDEFAATAEDVAPVEAMAAPAPPEDDLGASARRLVEALEDFIRNVDRR